MDYAHMATTLDTIVARAVVPDTDAPPFLSDEEIQTLRGAADMLRDAPSKLSRPAAAGKRWDEAEDARLCRAFDDGASIADLAVAHGRTRTAISLRLVKFGRLDAASVPAPVRERVAKGTLSG